MKWKNRTAIKMSGGMFGNSTEMCRAINKNADVLIECCNKIEELSKDIERLKAGEQVVYQRKNKKAQMF